MTGFFGSTGFFFLDMTGFSRTVFVLLAVLSLRILFAGMGSLVVDFLLYDSLPVIAELICLPFGKLEVPFGKLGVPFGEFGVPFGELGCLLAPHLAGNNVKT